MITPKQSELLELSLRSIIKCWTIAETPSGRSQLSKTRNPIIQLLSQPARRLHRSMVPVSSCKDWGWIRSGNRNHHPFRQTELWFSGLNYSTPTLVERISLAASPRASVTAVPGEKMMLSGTRSTCCTNQKMSCFRLKYVLLAGCSTTHCLLPSYSSGPTTNRAGQRLPLTVCCPPRSQQQDAAFTLQVRFPLPSGSCYVFREKISFTGCLPWRKETVCYFCSLQGWW